MNTWTSVVNEERADKMEGIRRKKERKKERGCPLVALSTPLTPKEEKGQSTDKTWPLSNFKQQLGKENKQTNKPKRDRESRGGGEKHPGSQPDNEGVAASLSLSLSAFFFSFFFL